MKDDGEGGGEDVDEGDGEGCHEGDFLLFDGFCWQPDRQTKEQTNWHLWL